MLRTISLIAIISLSLNAKAQEMWGISNSNYAGTMGIFLNPSTIVAAPYKYDINLHTLNVFASNNYAYSPARDKIIYNSIRGSETDGTVVTDNFSNERKSAFVHALAVGPSFVRSKGKSAWGIYNAFRTETGVLKVPFSITNFVTQATSNYGNIEVKPFSSAFMSWAETGLTYGRVGIKKEKDFLKWAVTMKLLAGFNGIYLDMRKFNFSLPSTTAVDIHSLDARFAHAVSSNGQATPADIFAIRGWGLGTTLGVTYVHNRKQVAYNCTNEADNLRKYQYRIGASLMDIGKIRFRDEASVVNMKTESTRTWDSKSSAKFGSFNSFDTTLVNHTGGTVEAKPFDIWLPMAFSVQFDYSLTPHVYANATVLNRLHFIPNEIARGNQTTLSLRYERRIFETSVNVNLFEYSQPSVGASLRFLYFVVGTDRLLQGVGVQNLQSFDVYFGIRMNMCKLGSNKKRVCPAFKSSSSASVSNN